MFLGHAVTQHKTVSEETAHIIDEEIRNIINRNYERAERLLKEHMDKLNNMADALIKYETIDQDQIGDIMGGKTPRPPADWSDEGQGPKDGATVSADTSRKDDKPADGTIGGPASLH